MPVKTVTEFAYAKVNLTLHVTGQREDGYHLLDSLVVFAGIGDQLHATQAGVSSLTLEGPFGAELPADMDNLVLKAAQVFGHIDIAFTLEKNLPPASGIGGGSADAAAAIRAVLRIRQENEDTAELEKQIAALDPEEMLRLGADLPVCLMSHPARMRGIGGEISLVRTPECWITLVNPRVEIPTPQAFKALKSKTNPPMQDVLPDWRDASELASWLALQRNDLEIPALSIAPVINDVLSALQAQPGALITRMSGSGATCFALFSSQEEAEAAAGAIRQTQDSWWTAAGVVYAGRANMVL